MIKKDGLLEIYSIKFICLGITFGAAYLKNFVKGGEEDTFSLRT